MFIVRQTGADAVWCKSAPAVVYELCQRFGFKFEDRYQSILPQIESLQKGCAIKNKDLSLSVEHV